jgi:hypothetical protein
LLKQAKAEYTCNWINTKTGIRKGFNLNLDENVETNFKTPEFTEDIALKIVKKAVLQP